MMSLLAELEIFLGVFYTDAAPTALGEMMMQFLQGWVAAGG